MSKTDQPETDSSVEPGKEGGNTDNEAALEIQQISEEIEVAKPIK